MKEILKALLETAVIILLIVLLSIKYPEYDCVPSIIVSCSLMIIITILNIINERTKKISFIKALEIISISYIIFPISLILSFMYGCAYIEYILITPLILIITWLHNTKIILRNIDNKKFKRKYLIITYGLISLFILTDFIRTIPIIFEPILNEYIIYKVPLYAFIFLYVFNYLKKGIQN